jgi:hypothetical protein
VPNEPRPTTAATATSVKRQYLHPVN